MQGLPSLPAQPPAQRQFRHRDIGALFDTRDQEAAMLRQFAAPYGHAEGQLSDRMIFAMLRGARAKCDTL